MIRIIIASVIIFLLEVCIFKWGHPVLLDYLTREPFTKLTFTEKQQRIINYIGELKTLNEGQIKSAYGVGGSTGREFFFPNDEMSYQLGIPFVNMASANQNMLDTIRLIDNIRTKGSFVFFCLFPYKLMKEVDPDIEADTKYLMGTDLKYPIISPQIDDMLKNVVPENHMTRFLPELNVYVYLIRDYFSWKKNLKNNPNIGYKDRSVLVKELNSFKKQHIGPHVEKNLDVNFSLLEKSIRLCEQKGVRFIIIELPYSSTFKSVFSEELLIYQNKLSDFSKKHPDIKIIAFDYDSYKGEEKYFYDHGHLVDIGRNFFTKSAVKLLTKEINADDVAD